MKLEKIGVSRTLLTLSSGSEIFYSYNTPVAAKVSGEFYKTNEYYSKTTSKHITQYLNGRYAHPVEQSFINQIVGA
tara:strand:- start:229 stop:456 length:228 start_codon:yes stop_codon:yes gene_type:complete